MSHAKKAAPCARCADEIARLRLERHNALLAMEVQLLRDRLLAEEAARVSSGPLSSGGSQ